MQTHPDISLTTANKKLNFILNIFSFSFKDLQADMRRITEEFSKLRKRSETFDVELATTVKNINEHQKVKNSFTRGRLFKRRLARVNVNFLAACS